MKDEDVQPRTSRSTSCFLVSSVCASLLLLTVLLSASDVSCAGGTVSRKQVPVCPSRNLTFPCICAAKSSAPNMTCSSGKLNSHMVRTDSRSLSTGVPPDPVSLMSKMDLSGRMMMSNLEGSALANLSDVEELDLSRNGISSIGRGSFRSLKKLKVLDLSHNSFSSFDRSDLQDLTTLQKINLSGNANLSKLPQSFFTRNTQLRRIDLSAGSLTEVDVYLLRGVRFLERFSASHNAITSLARKAFSTNTRLRSLDLSFNRIQVIPSDLLVGLQLLDYVNLSHNLVGMLESAAFQQLPKVSIDLSHNQIPSIVRSSFVECLNMRNLDLSHNNISSIHREAFVDSDVSALDLSFNSISNLSLVPVGSLPAIQFLNLSFNEVTSVGKKSFLFGPNVKSYEMATIDLSHNKIRDLSGSLFEKFWALRFLNLSHNSLRRTGFGAFGNTPSLLELDLSQNQLRDVGGIGGMSSLKTVYLQENAIASVPTISVALNYLHLQSNRIQSVSCSSFPSINSLLHLDLHNNSLSTFDPDSFCGLLTLRYLDLASNNISLISDLSPALQRLSSLQTLNVSDNRITEIGSARAFGGLPTLFHLSLSRNNISRIAAHAFDGLLQLLTLNMSSNAIKSLETDALKGLSSLQSIDLSHNRLTRIENKTHSMFEDLLSLRSLKLEGNLISILTPKSLPSSPWYPFNISDVDLSHNHLFSFPTADGFASVRTLDLSHNRISRLTPEVFGNMSLLHDLDLSYNHLTEVPALSFTSSRSADVSLLHKLNVSSNRIERLSVDELTSLPFLQSVDMASNRLDADFKPSSVKHVSRLVVHGISVGLTQAVDVSCCCCRRSYDSD